MIISAEQETIIRALLPHAQKSYQKALDLAARGIRVADVEDIPYLVITAILDMLLIPEQSPAFDRGVYEWDFRRFLAGHIDLDEAIKRFKLRILDWK